MEQPLHNLSNLSDERLVRLVRYCEQHIIAGSAVASEYDTYVTCQLILAQRELSVGSVCDPRD
jgi:hypothetical protein